MTTMLTKEQLPELDYAVLNRELDKTKTKVFLGSNAAFLGPLMCSLEFIWSTDVPTAATNGVYVKWNPYYFHFLTPAGRQSILVHELWHVGLMHMLRRGTRNMEVWNYACDTVLDNMMDLEGYVIDETLFPPELFPPGSQTFKAHVKYGTKAAEEIYDDMAKSSTPPPAGGMGMDLIEPSPGDSTIQHQVINAVISAVHAAKLAGAGNLPGDLETTIKKFLQPKIDWDKALFGFFNELGGQDYSWARPNRRYQDMYLPSLREEYDALSHIIYYEDVSGSISEADAIRFNSEFKYVHDYFRPEKMTMVQFDTRIQKEDVFLKDDEFLEIKIVGRGGTSLHCVHEHIVKHKPSAVVVFSDLQCEPMAPLPPDLAHVPIIWIALNNRGAHVNQGKIVHLHE
jgi:predicted metal-dependent peptidase